MKHMMTIQEAREEIRQREGEGEFRYTRSKYTMMKIMRDILIAIKPGIKFRKEFNEKRMAPGKRDHEKGMEILADNIREGIDQTRLTIDELADIYESRVTLYEADLGYAKQTGFGAEWLLERMTRADPDKLCRDMYVSYLRRMINMADSDEEEEFLEKYLNEYLVSIGEVKVG